MGFLWIGLLGNRFLEVGFLVEIAGLLVIALGFLVVAPGLPVVTAGKPVERPGFLLVDGLTVEPLPTLMISRRCARLSSASSSSFSSSSTVTLVGVLPPVLA